MKMETDKVMKADVVVIGTGAAGCVVMKELSKCFSVIGLEAGPNITSDPSIQAIGLDAFLLPASAPEKYFWPGFRQTRPMQGLNGRVSDWTTGFGAGGGSAINGLYAGRGTNAVYSQWANIANSANWSQDKILATFKQLENYHGLTITPDARGSNGPVNILQTPTVSQLTLSVLLPALQVALPGIPLIADYNDPSVENGIDLRAQWFIKDNARVSSATAFLEQDSLSHRPHRSHSRSRSHSSHSGFHSRSHRRASSQSTLPRRSCCHASFHEGSLKILYNAVALKILFEEKRCSERRKKIKAHRVEFLMNGNLHVVEAKRAVILSAGINSSKLLQLSGIGPRSVLTNANVPVLLENNYVGQHLQNHPTLFVSLLANPTDNGIPPGAPYAYSIANIFLPVVGASASDPRVFQLIFEYFPAGTQGSPVALLVLGIVLVTPLSEGSVNIQSNNAFQIAAADDGFYQDPLDLQNMMQCVQVYVRNILDQLALVSPGFYEPIPTDPINLVRLQNYSDASVEAYVKNNTNLNLDIHHFVGHCKMSVLDGVVDGNTRVHKTKNVFVVDNAICPSIPNINTTEPAMMIGLRASEILKRLL